MKLKTVIAACAVAMLSLTSLASTYTWKSSVSEGDWATAENWESSDGGEAYPSSGDTAVFAADTTATVTLSSAPTIAKLDLSAATGGITFTPAADKSRDSVKLTATTVALPTTAGASVTLDGAALTTPNALTIANGTTLSLLNSAYLTLSSDTTRASGQIYNYLGGKFIVRDSTFKGYGYCWGHADGLTVIDNSEFSLYRTFYWMQNSGGTVRFEGKNPKVRFRKSDESVCKGVNTSYEALAVTANWEFSIPEGGYKETPVFMDHTGGLLGLSSESAPLYIKVDSNSPAKLAGETLQQQLIYWWRATSNVAYKGISTKVVQTLAENLPQTTDSFVWGDVPSGSSLYPSTLDVSLSGCYFKTSVRKTTSAWEGIDLTDFETSVTASRPLLYIAWGKADGGTTDAGWDHVEALGTVAAGSDVRIAASGKLELKNAAKLTLSDSDATKGYVGNYDGGQFILRGQSVYAGYGYRYGDADGLTIIDNSELSLYRVLIWNTDGGTIRFEGKNPMVRFRKVGETFDDKVGEAVVRGNDANLSTTWEFSIPEGGYDAPPVLCDHHAGQIGNTQLTSPIYIKVAADSPAKLASRKLTQRLISWYAEDGDKTASVNTCGINTTVVKTLQENLPSKSDKFVWGEPATDKQFPSTLDVQFTNGLGLMLIIR